MKTAVFEQKGKAIDFVDLNKEEQIMVLHWRNHSDVRQWMLHPALITVDEHLSFIKSLEKRKDKHYFLYTIQQENLGVVDFTCINIKHSSSKFGLYINPKLQGKGIGTKLMQFSITYAFKVLKLKTLTLEVFSHNERAVNLYKKFNFKMISHKIINGQKVLFMQLNNT